MVIASAAPTMPVTAPASSPMRATHGAKAIEPSVADHENASMRPQVAAMAATATNVTKWRRRSMTASRSLRGCLLLVRLTAVQRVHEHEARRQQCEEDRGAEVLEHEDRVRDAQGLRADDVARLRPPDVRLRAVVALDDEAA